MKIYWNNLSSHLKKNNSVWLLSGMEPLLIEESITNIGKLYPTYEKHHFMLSAQFNWQDVEEAMTNNSLFTNNKLLKIVMPGGKVGREGSKKIKSLIKKASTTTVLIFSASSTTSSWAKKTAWVADLESVGCHVQHPEPSHQVQLEWVSKRFQEKKMKFDNSAVRLLVYLCEGNLLALQQEIDFLSLCEDDVITEEIVHQNTQDQSRFNIFGLSNQLFKGNPNKALRICRSLRLEGIEPILISSILCREVQLIRKISDCLILHLPLKNAFKGIPMWPAREKELISIARNRSPEKWQRIILHLQKIDRQCKGTIKGDSWLSIEQLIPYLTS